ncbi:MAG: MarR family winged helix-turn-helix transcriptional regulator [Thermacetogeniaceae bacterium]
MPDNDDQKIDNAKGDDLFALFEEIMRAILYIIHQQGTLELPCKTTPQQMMMGVFLLQHGGRLTVTQVANELGVSLSAVTASANRMSRTGLLGRYRDQADHRVVWLELTPPGKESVAAFLHFRDRLWRRFFNYLEEQDRADLYRILSRVKQASLNLRLAPDSDA